MFPPPVDRLTVGDVLLPEIFSVFSTFSLRTTLISFIGNASIVSNFEGEGSTGHQPIPGKKTSAQAYMSLLRTQYPPPETLIGLKPTTNLEGIPISLERRVKAVEKSKLSPLPSLKKREIASSAETFPKSTSQSYFKPLRKSTMALTCPAMVKFLFLIFPAASTSSRGSFEGIEVYLDLTSLGTSETSAMEIIERL